MSYISKRILTKDELIMIKPEKNPIFLVLKWVWGILGCWLLFIPTIQAIKATIKFCTTEYLVTNKRALEKYGWVATQTDDIMLNKVENVTVTYSFWGRIFNYGNICIQGANQNNVNFNCVMDAEWTKRQISSLL